MNYSTLIRSVVDKAVLGPVTVQGELCKHAHRNSILCWLSFTWFAVLYHKVLTVSELLDGIIMCACLC